MKEIFRRLLKNKLSILGLIIILLQLILIIFAPLIAPYSPSEQKPASTFAKPGTPGHILGTDDIGRDIFSRIVYGTRLTYLIGFSVLIIAISGGIPIGMIAGYFPRLDNILMRLIEVLMSFPPLLLALAITLIVGRGLTGVILAVGIGSIPHFARLSRSTVLSIKSEEYVSAAKALGASNFKIIVKHILPNCLSPLIVQATFRVATAVLSAAALSFLGVGVRPPAPEWGAMLNQGRAFIYNAPHISTFPGLAIFLTVLGFNLIGDGLRDALDPKIDC